MRFPFKELPGTSGDYLRPAVPVTVEGIARAPQLCLLDTGALHNRFAAWVADAAGVDLTGGDEERFAVGGFVTAARLDEKVAALVRTERQRVVKQLLDLLPAFGSHKYCHLEKTKITRRPKSLAGAKP